MSGNLGANLINQLQNTPMASPDYWGKQMSNMNALQDYNAKQAWGQALQQATDPTTGQVDYGKAQALAAGNPMARAGMATNLQNTSNIQSQQIDQAHANVSLIGQLSAAGIKDPSDANVAAIRAQAVNAHAPPGAIAEIDRIAALPVNQRANEFYNHNLDSLDALGRLQYGRGGVPTTFQTGDTIQGGTYDPVTGALRPAGQPVQMGLTPGQATGLDSIDIGGGNHIQVPHGMVGDVLKNNPGWKAIIGSSGGGGGPDPLAALPKSQALAGVQRRESGGQNVNTAILGPDGKPASTASGYYQMVDGTWQEGAALAGIKNPPPRAIMASKADQDAAASALYDKYGLQPWARSAPGAPGAAAAPPATTPPATTTTPPAAPAGPPGVQMGGAPPPPPGGSQAPYTGGGVGAALAPGGTANPVVIRGTPIPAGKVVGAIQQGMQTAAATPMPANALMAGPGAPSAVASAPASPAMPQSGWGSVVGSYGGGPAAPAAPAPAAPIVAPQPGAQPSAPTLGVSAPPGYAEAQQITAKAAAARGNDLVNQLTASSTVKPILAEMEDVLTKSGGTGFGTAHISAFRQALERLGLTPAAVDVATPQAALETFKKLSSQLQGAQLGTVGGVPTDDRQSLIEASNPSVLNSTAGNKSIIHVLQGTQQALETMGRAWMASPDYQNNPGNFDKWRTKFTAKDPTTGGQFDPRTFWLNNMPPDEQHAYLSNMTPKGLAEFKKNWAYARGQGWVEPLTGQSAPAPGG